jgi:hypothetical protein
MKDEINRVRWTDLLNEYKYCPLELLSMVDSSDRTEAVVQASIESTAELCLEWPLETRQWRVLLLALMAVEIGTIADTHSRTRAYEQLFSGAREWHITPTAVRMASVEIYPIYERLKDNLLELALIHNPGHIR